MNTTNDRIIIGIDPGTNVMGYGVLRIVGNTPELMTLGVIQLNKFESHYLRLRRIFERVLGLIEQYLPDEMAIEAPFFGKNVQSMLKLGRAQGVAMAAALSRDIPITEYAPLKIKMSITGNGSASKEQVAAMLQRILHIPDENMPPLLDATDGLSAISTRPTGLISKKATTVGKTSSTKIPIKYRLERNLTRNNKELSFYRTTNDRHLLASIFFRTNIRPVQRRAPLAFCDTNQQPTNIISKYKRKFKYFLYKIRSKIE